MAPKSKRQTAAKVFANATAKVALAITIVVLWLTMLPIAGAAADVQISAARASALKECSRLAQRYPINDWGNTESYLYRSCMARHGQKE
jgi:hypothetical protein